MCHKKIVLKTKSIVMRTTNNQERMIITYSQKYTIVHILSGYFLSLTESVIFLEIFHYFQYFERFRLMKKWQISTPKIVDWYLDFSKESYTTLDSVISSLKTCFQNYGQLKRKFLRPKKYKKYN